MGKYDMKRFCLVTFVIIIFFNLLVSKFSYSNENFNGFVHSKGRDLLDGNENKVKLRGFNLGGWLLWEGWGWGMTDLSESKLRSKISGIVGKDEFKLFENGIYSAFITKNDIRKISEYGFNSVRVLFNHSLLEDENGPLKIKNDGWQYLDSVVEWCSDYNMYVVLDLHAAPGGQNPAPHSNANEDSAKWLWKSEENMNRTVFLWNKIADRYKNNTTIAGYDLLNEPVAPNDSILFNFYQKITESIRKVDRNHLIIYEGNLWGGSFNSSIYKDKNIALSFHIYTWDSEKIKNIENICAYYGKLGDKFNLPVWCGEWGTNTYEIMERTFRALENSQNNFCGWSFYCWKRIYDLNDPNPTAFVLNDDWKILDNKIGSKINELPNNFDVHKAVEGFINNVRLENCRIDEKLLKMLGNY